MKLSAIRAALAELQLAPSKTLGQNFLHDQNLARWIVAQLDIQPGEHLVEIGPGLGALTGEALAAGARLTALEKDRRLAEFLWTRFATQENFRVEHLDALDFDVRSLWPHRPAKVFGNLPYYISTPLLFHFTSPDSPTERAVFLLQRELAERIAATPGGKDYGILSLVVGRRWRVELLRVLPATVFLPEPRVDSALIRLVPRGADDLPVCDARAFEELVRAGFSQRRKQLGKLLAAFFHRGGWSSAAARIGCKETARGEELSLEQWIQLTNLVKPVSAGEAQDINGERFDIVDERDEVVGSESRGTVHARNLRHRAVHLFVFNPLGEIFLQKRSRWKDKHPGKWDSSAAGHLDSGEDYLTAARRELSEELGIPNELVDVLPLDEIGALAAQPETGWEFIRVYRLEHAGPFHWPAAEIEWGGFFPVAMVEAWISAHPEDFAPGFLECWRTWRDLPKETAAAIPPVKTA